MVKSIWVILGCRREERLSHFSSSELLPKCDTSTKRYKREIFAHCPCLSSPRCMLHKTRGIVDGKAATISSVAYACSARGVLLIFYAKSVKAPWPVRAKSTANSVDTAYQLLVKKLMNFSGLMSESIRNDQNSMLHMYNCE